MNQSEFLQIFDIHGDEIYSFVYLRCNYQREIAEDLTQEVFLRAWKARESYDRSKAAGRTWLFRIARNALIDHYRKKRESTNDSAAQELIEKTAEVELENAALRHSIQQGLERLSDEDRELITLRYIQDLELMEIAEIVGKNYNAVKVAIHRAVAKLKQIINA